MNSTIEYTLVRKRIKNVYIQIKDGKVIVKAPYSINKSKIDEIISQKREWISKRVLKSPTERKIDTIDKNYIYILNNKINIKYQKHSKSNIIVNLDENTCIVMLPQSFVNSKENVAKINKKIDNELKKLANKYIMNAMEKYIALTGLTPCEIKIRKFKSIWGNCSSKKVIKINQNLIHYGIEQIEYVCLHEITHLKYMNHQKEFWNFVKKYMPNYKEISSELKQ